MLPALLLCQTILNPTQAMHTMKESRSQLNSAPEPRVRPHLGVVAAQTLEVQRALVSTAVLVAVGRIVRAYVTLG